MPKEVREKIELEAELLGFLKQSRISAKNIKRLRELTGHADSSIGKSAELLIRVAKIAEGKRKRWRRVGQADRELLRACTEAGLIPCRSEWVPEAEYRGLYQEEEEDVTWLESTDAFLTDGFSPNGTGDRPQDWEMERSPKCRDESEALGDEIPF